MVLDHHNASDRALAIVKFVEVAKVRTDLIKQLLLKLFEILHVVSGER